MKDLDTLAIANKILGYLSSLSAGGILIYYILFKKIKKLLIWAVVFALIGIIFLSRYTDIAKLLLGK